MLMRRGALQPGLTYGAAYAGVDTFAAAVEEENGGRWQYEFASEKDEGIRGALLLAWKGRGLVSRSPVLHRRERRRCAARAPSGPNGDDTKLRGILTPQPPPGTTRPTRLLGGILVEPRVCESEGPLGGCGREWNRPAGSRAPVTGLLRRLSGYTMETASLDPRAVAGVPMARNQQFSVLESLSAEAKAS